MNAVPAEPRIYHITHVENLPSIIQEGGLWSDAVLIDRGRAATTIGMGSIKQRRLGLPVKCHPGDRVGDYVPFYFCPRSIMLFLIHRANHPELSYRGGQEPILHLEADLHEAISWARGEGRRWAFSLSNAGAAYAEFRDQTNQLGEIDWEAVAATDFRETRIKEGKQAEFLIQGFFPWHLVRRIGAHSVAVQQQVLTALTAATHRPQAEVCPMWYF